MTLPNIDVVIPVHGRSNLVLKLVDSLRDQRRLGSIVIVDDASPEIDETVLKTIGGVKYYRNRGNEGFISSVNRGVKKTESEYILILNSDTEATHPHCIERMAENLDDGAAVCGALLIYPKTDPYRAERVQHAGVCFDSTGFPNHVLANWPYTEPVVQTRRSVPAVTGACLMTTKAWWEKLGGFDTHLGMGTFEDVDYCIRVKKLGGEIIYEPQAVFYHAEHASQSQDGGWFTNDNLHRNFTYLMMKHGKQEPSDKYWFKGV